MTNDTKISWVHVLATLALFFMMAVSVNGATAPGGDTDPPEPVCGDGMCVSGETSVSCPADCSSTDTDPPQTTYVCGNGMCETGETTASCPADCSGSPNDDGDGDGDGDGDDDGGSNEGDDDGTGGSGGGSSSRNLLIQRILEQLVAVLTELISLVIAQQGV